MGKEETSVTHSVMLDTSKIGVVLYKNVRGLFWTLDKSHKIKAGLLCEGSSDLIGYTPIKITEEMVGKTVAVFTAIESKTPTGTAFKEQRDFMQRVRDRGGISGIARCASDAINIIHAYRRY